MAISLADLKAEVRVTHSHEDALLQRKLDAAIDHVESYTRATIDATMLTHVLDAFPCGPIRLPRGPVKSVTSIKYIHPSTGMEVTLPPDRYEVDTVGVPGWVAPATAGWPATMATINAVRIAYVAGYTDAPAPLVEAALKLAVHLYEWRGVATEGALAVVPAGFHAMLAPFRNWN